MRSLALLAVAVAAVVFVAVSDAERQNVGLCVIVMDRDIQGYTGCMPEI